MAIGALIQSFAAPASGTNGIAWDGRSLWVVDVGTDLIYQLDPIGGAIIRSFAAPQDTSRGIAWDPARGTLWTVESTSNLIYQISTSGRVIKTIPSPSTFDPGITHSGAYLYVVENTANNNVHIVDPSDGTVIRTVSVDVGAPTGISIHNGSVWLSGNTANEIAQTAFSGNIIQSIPAPTSNPQDLTFDNSSIWVHDLTTIYRMSLS